MSPEPDDVDDAIEAAAANTDEATSRHAAQQRAHLLDLAAAADSDRWEHDATDAGFLIRTERASISVGELRTQRGVDATVRADWTLDNPRLIVEHNEADCEASVGLALSAEAAEGLALDLLELAQEQREARDADD
jgi:hypothetical protein